MLSACLVLLAGRAAASDWMVTVRSCVQQQRFECARAAVDERLRENPQDLEALTWRARLLAWTGDWNEAERQYRAVLARVPSDGDVLLGLADIYLWRGDYSRALDTLEQAERATAAATEVLPRRARALRGLHRDTEATAAYDALLRINPDDSEARKAREVLKGPPEPHHELRIGSDTDTFNYTDAANTEIISLASKWNRHWRTEFSGVFSQRFGQFAQELKFGASYRLAQHDWLSAGAGFGNRQEVTPRHEFNVEYGHAFPARFSVVRGIELTVQHRNIWFTTSHVTTVDSTGLFYLPHDWLFSLRGSAVRSAFGGAGAEWVPSGLARLTFPMSVRWKGNLFFGVGTENFSQIDQIGRFSSRTFGGGLRCQLTPQQDVAVYVAAQDRSQGRSQFTVGISYGIRF